MNFKIEGNKLIRKFDGETLVVEGYGKDSIRVRSRMMESVIDTDFSLLPQENNESSIVIEGDKATVTNGKIKAVVTVEGWTKRSKVTFYNQEGKKLIEEIGAEGCLTLNPHKFTPRGSDFKLVASFKSNEKEKLFGMGQYQQEILDLKNCSIELAHRNSQASVPFVLSSEGYGFLWHNPSIGKAYFNKNCTEWVAENTKQLDYWITAGDTPRDILENYSEATGKPPMMPEYGLGFWQCKLRYWNQEQLLEVARKYKKENVPIDVIVCDFFHWPRMGDFRFEEEFFPDPKAMVDELKEMGIELMVSVWPQVSLQSENFEEMRNNNYLISAERGINVSMRFPEQSVFYDATNPEANEYVWNKCKKNYYDHGIKVFWLDEAEPEYEGYDFGNYRYHLGSDLMVGNIYPQKYSKCFYDGLKAEGHTEIVNLVRCAWSGSQRYGALVWSGDIHSTYQDFRNQICAGINMGISGIPWWTTDIGGFHGGNPKTDEFRDLLVRWFQFGAFCPVMRLHGDRSTETWEERRVFRKNGEEALFTGGDNEIWSYGEENFEILKKYINIREILRDYTRNLMKESHEKGTPVIRSMFFEFPEDKECWDLKDQYFYGSDILVAPITEEFATKRQVYLPQGVWVNAHDEKEYVGGQFITVDAPIDVIPVFLRNSAVELLKGRI